MGDRRVADRRAAEEGVVKIETKKLILYLILGTIFIISIIANVVLGILYYDCKEAYESLKSLTNEDENDYAEITDDSEKQYTCDLSITPDKEQVKAGETITYELKAENIDAGNGIVMFTTVMNYDTESFECEVVTDKDSEWTKAVFVDNYITMSRKDLSPSQEDQTIAKIVLTAKNNIQKGDSTFNLKNIVFTMDDDKTFTLPDENITVHVTNN